MKKIAIVGGGGFGVEIFYVWRDKLLHDNNQYEFIGFFDDGKRGQVNSCGEVVGVVEDINTLDENIEVAIAIGNPKILRFVRERIKSDKIVFPNIIHPTAKFLDTKSFALSQGNIFSIDTIISNNVTLGSFNIFNTRATLGHDVTVGDYNVFGPNAQISGEVIIGDNNLFGFNAGVIQQNKIGNRNVLGVGSILLRNISDDGTYVGTPAKKFNA